MKLSKRMQALADMVSLSGTFIDVGCDHGFLPIYLVQEGKVSHAIAMDINKGPLERAKEHIAAEHLEKQIETRLSDGLAGMIEKEADTCLIAGMGGGIILHILDDRFDKATSVRELILQPQSEIYEVRKYLLGHHFHFLEENIIEEDNKYYPMMKVSYCPKEPLEEWSEVELTYGKMILASKNATLQELIEKEIATKSQILAGLQKQMDNEKIVSRVKELQGEIELAKQALKRMR